MDLPQDMMRLIYTTLRRSLYRSEYGDKEGPVDWMDCANELFSTTMVAGIVCKDWMRRVPFIIRIPERKVTPKLKKPKWTPVIQSPFFLWARSGAVQTVHFYFNDAVDLAFVTKWLDAAQQATPDGKMQVYLYVGLGFFRTRIRALRHLQTLVPSSRRWTCVQKLSFENDSGSKFLQTYSNDLTVLATFGKLFANLEYYKLNLKNYSTEAIMKGLGWLEMDMMYIFDADLKPPPTKRQKRS